MKKLSKLALRHIVFLAEQEQRKVLNIVSDLRTPDANLPDKVMTVHSKLYDIKEWAEAIDNNES